MNDSGTGPVLVTGASGFIGSRVTARLRSQQVEVVHVDHRWNDRHDLRSVIGDARPVWCVHLGWYAHPQDYLTNVAANERSVAASLELVDVLEEIGCRRLVVAGSCAEYATSATRLTEDAPLAPWSAYGRAKVALHEALTRVSPDRALRIAWGRIFYVMGPGEHPDRLVPWVVRRLRAGEPVELTEGTQVRDYLDVDDVASAFVALGRSEATGAFNICSGTGHALRDLLLGLAARVGHAEQLRFGARARSEHDADVVVGDRTRISTTTGWSPAHDLDAMLDRAASSTETEPAEGT